MAAQASVKKLENQIQFLSLLGPFLFLLSFSLLLYKLAAHWYLPVSALVGLPLCVKWRLRGMIGALSLLICLSFVSYREMDLDERYWHVGMSIALAFSFIVLALSLDESDAIMGNLQIESKSRLDNLIQIEENWRTAETNWNEEKNAFSHQIQTLVAETAKIREEREVFSKLVHLSKDELFSLHQQKELLIQASSKNKQQLIQLQRQLEEQKELNKATLSHAESQANELASLKTATKKQTSAPKSKRPEIQETDLMPLYVQLKEQFAEKNQLLHQTRQQLFLLQEHLSQHELEQKELHFSISPNEKHLEEGWTDLMQKYLVQKEQWRDEVSHLQRIITRLLS